MALLLRDIIHSLGDYAMRGNLGETIYRVTVWDDSKRLTPEGDSCGVLYIASDVIYLQFFDERNIIFVPTAQIEKTVRQVNEMLLQDYQRSAAFIKLQAAIAHDNDGDTVAGICREIMRNPVWIFNGTKRMLGFSGSSIARAFVENAPKLMDGIRFNGNELVQDGKFPYRCISGSITHGNEVSGYIVVAYMENSMESAAEKSYLQAICTIMDLWPCLHRLSDRELIDDTILNEILMDKIADGDLIRSKMAHRNFRTYDKYYLMTIDIGNAKPSDSIKQKIRALANHNVATYGSHYVMLWGVKINAEICRADFSGLLPYLEENSMRMALSNAFSDEGRICNAFEQCMLCLRVKSAHAGKKPAFVRYEDIMLSHMLLACEQQGINLLDLCNATMMEIHEKDKENDTQLVKTIMALLLNDMNFSTAADLLHIHKNTIYRRLGTLKEKYGVDLNDPFMRNKLMITVYIMDYLGMEDMTALIDRDILKKYIPVESEAVKRRNTAAAIPQQKS